MNQFIKIPYEFVKGDFYTPSGSYLNINVDHIVSFKIGSNERKKQNCTDGKYGAYEIYSTGNYISLFLSNQSAIIIETYHFYGYNGKPREEIDEHEDKFRKFFNKLKTYLESLIKF